MSCDEQERRELGHQVHTFLTENFLKPVADEKFWGPFLKKFDSFLNFFENLTVFNGC